MNGRGAGHARTNRRARRPAVEALEGRLAPSGFLHAADASSGDAGAGGGSTGASSGSGSPQDNGNGNGPPALVSVYRYGHPEEARLVPASSVSQFRVSRIPRASGHAVGAAHANAAALHRLGFSSTTAVAARRFPSR